MDQLKENTTHVVVQFVLDKQPNNKESIDLVPRTWVTLCRGKWMCYFPEEKDWPKVDRWARMSKNPEQDWKSWEVIIIKEAADYDQGQRRLKKACANLRALTSTTEDTDINDEENSRPVVLRKDDALAELNAIPLHVPVLRNKNNTQTRNSNDNPVAILMDRFDHFERTIKQELENIKRSILYDLHKSMKDMKNTLTLNVDRPFGMQLTECRNDLAIILPLNTVEQFMQLNEQLSLDTKKEKSFKFMMTSQIIGVESIAKGISVILTSLLNKDIQLQYSACGRETSGQKKKSFCDTMTFKCMKDVLVEKFSVSEKEIVAKTSRWFTGASDRAGGRKERNRPKEKEKEKEKERESEQST